MTDVTRLKKLLVAQKQAPPAETQAQCFTRVENVAQWHDQAFMLIREVLDEAGIEYAVPAVKIALRGDMPGLACGHEVTISTPSGRRLVIVSVGANVIHVEALPMIRITLGDEGPSLHHDGIDGTHKRWEKFTPESFVGFLERWASGDI